MNRRSILRLFGLAPVAAAVRSPAAVDLPIAAKIDERLSVGLITRNEAIEELGGFAIPADLVEEFRAMLKVTAAISHPVSVSFENTDIESVRQLRQV